MNLWPFSTIAALKRDLFYAERSEKAWQQHALAAESELAMIRASRSAASIKAAATVRAKVLRKAEEMRGEGE